MVGNICPHPPAHETAHCSQDCSGLNEIPPPHEGCSSRLFRAFEIDGPGKIFKSCNFSAKPRTLTERVFLYRLVVFCPAPKNSSRRRAKELPVDQVETGRHGAGSPTWALPRSGAAGQISLARGTYDSSWVAKQLRSGSVAGLGCETN